MTTLLFRPPRSRIDCAEHGDWQVNLWWGTQATWAGRMNLKRFSKPQSTLGQKQILSSYSLVAETRGPTSKKRWANVISAESSSSPIRRERIYLKVSVRQTYTLFLFGQKRNVSLCRANSTELQRRDGP